MVDTAHLKDLLVAGVSRFVGKVFLSADPTSDLEAATKHYVDQKSDSDQATIDTKYVKRSGDTMTGVLTAKGGMYEDAYNGALNMNNSDIYGLNSFYTADAADAASEGMQFYRDSTHVDSLWVSGGDIMFVPNRVLGTQTTKANSQKVGRFTANPETGMAVITDGTTGGMTTRGIRNNTSTGALGWTAAATDTTLATTNTIAYWNGAYRNTDSNIEYVKKGKIGNLAIKDSVSATYTPAGSVGTPTITVTPNTASIGSASGWSAGSAASFSVSGGTLSITAGSAPSLTVTSTTVATGIKSATSSQPSWTGTQATITVS